MEKIFNIATQISTPLALSGFFAAIFFFLVKQIISRDIFPTLTKRFSSDIIKLIIHYIFILSLSAMVLGFIGFTISLTKNNQYEIKNKSWILIKGNVKNRLGQPIKGVSITIDGYDFQAISKDDGSFKAIFYGVDYNSEVITLRAFHPNYKSFSKDIEFNLLLKENLIIELDNRLK